MGTDTTAIMISAYSQGGGKYLLDLGAGEFEISGVFHSRSLYLNQSNALVVDEADLDKIYIVKRNQVIAGYINVDSKERITVAEFRKMDGEMEMLRTLIRSIDDEGEECEPVYEWKSTEDRIRHGIFKAVWQAVWEPIETKVQVGVKIIESQPRAHKFIQPMSKITGNLSDTVYVVNMREVVEETIREFFSELGWKEFATSETAHVIRQKQQELPNSFFFQFGKNGGVEGAKCFGKNINYEYMTIEISGLKRFEKAPTQVRDASFEKLEEQVDGLQKRIKNELSAWLRGNVQIRTLGNQTIDELLDLVDRAGNIMSRVDPMKKSYQDAHLVAKTISEIREMLIQNLSK